MMELLKKSTGTNESTLRPPKVRLFDQEVCWMEEGELNGDGRGVKKMMKKEKEKRRMEKSQAL